VPIDRLERRFLSPQYLEGLVLLAVAPWLLFPSQFPFLTLLALIVVALLWMWSWLRKRKPLPYTPFNGAILLFEIAILVGIIVTADPVDTLPKTTGVILGLTTWRYIAQTVRDRSMLYTLIILFFLAGLAFILTGALGTEWLVKIPFLEPIFNYVPSRLITPPESPVGGVHVNQLAGILAFYFPFNSVAIGLDGWFHRKRRRSVDVDLSTSAFKEAKSNPIQSGSTDSSLYCFGAICGPREIEEDLGRSCSNNSPWKLCYS